MNMKYSYTPHGVCSRAIQLDVEDGVVNQVQFIGGCSGNTQGIAALVQGMPLDEVVKRLEGIRCGSRPTSCPDQLAKALKKSQRNSNFLSQCKKRDKVFERTLSRFAVIFVYEIHHSGVISPSLTTRPVA